LHECQKQVLQAEWPLYDRKSLQKKKYQAKNPVMYNQQHKENKHQYSSRMYKHKCFTLAGVSSSSSFVSLPVPEAKITNKSYTDWQYYSTNKWSGIEITTTTVTYK